MICDFQGQGSMAILSESNMGHDSEDCRSAYLAGAPATQPQPLVSAPRGPIDGANRADGSIYGSGTVYDDPLAPGGRNAIRTAPPIPDLPTPA
jgi:hypothetical protein